MRSVERELPLNLTEDQYRQRLEWITEYEAKREALGVEAAKKWFTGVLRDRGVKGVTEEAIGVVPVDEREARQSFGKATLSGKPPEQIVTGAPAPVDPTTGMHKDYWVLPAEDRAKGFIRPVRTSYIHEKCGSSTRMNVAIAETYARNPGYYGRTFCCACGEHYPVGVDGEFVWPDGTKVGS
jgi:hypothetical protein